MLNFLICFRKFFFFLSYSIFYLNSIVESLCRFVALYLKCWLPFLLGFLFKNLKNGLWLGKLKMTKFLEVINQVKRQLKNPRVWTHSWLKMSLLNMGFSHNRPKHHLKNRAFAHYQFKNSLPTTINFTQTQLNNFI